VKKGFDIKIPSGKQLRLRYLLLDLNGTLAKDGVLIEGVAERLKMLANIFDIYILTADTHGTAERLFGHLPVKLHRLNSDLGAAEKFKFMKSLGEDYCVAIGNGRNDALMLKSSALGICIVGCEGTAIEAIKNSDLITNNINDALDLFLNPKRLIATLRG